MKLITLRDTFDIPPTVRRCDAALVLQENTLAPMLREVLNRLQLRGRPKRKMEVSEGAEADHEDEFVINPASLLREETATAAVTRGATRAAAHRVDRARFKVIPATTRSSTRRKQRPAGTPSPRPQQDEEPSITPASTATEGEEIGTPMEAERPALATEDSHQPTESDQTDHRPPVCRGHSEQLERMGGILRDGTQLKTAQQEDLLLKPIRNALEKG